MSRLDLEDYIARVDSLEPAPKCPGSLRKYIARGYIPKNLVPSVLAHEEPGPKSPVSIRKSIARGYVPKNLVPSVLARLGSLSPESTFLRTWSQVSWLTKSLAPLGRLVLPMEFSKKLSPKYPGLIIKKRFKPSTLNK